MESIKKSIEKRAQHKQEYDSRVNERQMQSKEGNVDSSNALDDGLVVTECSGTNSDKQVTSSSSGNYITHAVVADIRPVNDQVPFAEVQLTAQHNVLAIEQQNYVQSKPIYDTHLLEKVDRNTTPDLTNMCHRGGEIDQNAKKCQVLCPLLDPSFDNMTTKFSNQSLHKTVENADLKAQIQEKVFVNVALKNELRKLKGNSVDTKFAKPSILGELDLALYDNESWSDPRDFAKPVKAISLPQDVPSTSDRRLIELENQVQHLMEAYPAPKQSV
ncbi:hypothetical protein Tco_0901211 [Tanacetum coccineum]